MLGAMAIHSAVVAAPAAFPAANSPSFEAPFVPKRLVFTNFDATPANYVEVSFDGVTVAARLTPGANPTFDTELQNATKVWVRRGAGTPNVQIIAEV